VAADDSKLIKATLAGNGAAFAALVKEYQGLLYNMILRLVDNNELAADLTQEAFLKSYRSLPQFNLGKSQSFKPWLLRIGSNVALDYLRKQRAELSLDQILEEEPQKEPSSGRSVSEDVEEQIFIEELSLALGQIPLRYRQAFILRYQFDLSYEDISKVMQENENTVRTLLFRAKDKLRKLIDDPKADGPKMTKPIKPEAKQSAESQDQKTTQGAEHVGSN
jgi:RNA polymerase sigma-70 factor, ECF subfamily